MFTKACGIFCRFWLHQLQSSVEMGTDWGKVELATYFCSDSRTKVAFHSFKLWCNSWYFHHIRFKPPKRWQPLCNQLTSVDSVVDARIAQVWCRTYDLSRCLTRQALCLQHQLFQAICVDHWGSWLPVIRTEKKKKILLFRSNQWHFSSSFSPATWYGATQMLQNSCESSDAEDNLRQCRWDLFFFSLPDTVEFKIFSHLFWKDLTSHLAEASKSLRPSKL